MQWFEDMLPGTSVSCLSSALRKSGISRSFEKSPPPITFPALAVATEIPESAKKESQYAEVTISAAALLAEYGSCPPSWSFSR